MRLIYMIAADVLMALGWEVEIKEKDSYWSLVLTNTTSSEDMPESHMSCLRGLLRGWLIEFNFVGGRQQVNIYKELHGLDPEDDRYSCLDTCVNRTDSNTPQYKLNDREVFVRRKDRFDRYVLEEPVSENITTKLSTEQEAATRATINKQSETINGLLGDDPAETTTDAPEAWQDTFDPAMAAMKQMVDLLCKKEMAVIEDILRHHIDCPIEGELTREKVKAARIRGVMYSDNFPQLRSENNGKDIYISATSGLMGVVQGDWLIGADGARRPLTDKEREYYERMERMEQMSGKAQE